MKDYAIVGTGGRGYLMYGKAIVERFGDVARLVGLCDPNSIRCQYVREQLGGHVPTFTDFEEMVRETKPQVVFITMVDRYHAEYIKRAFALGCDVICEKPLAITAPMCRDILEAEEAYGRKVTVTFNCRFMPFFSRLKALLMEGAVGDILNVDFEWMLDTSHGADYFRRWHRLMANSGGLLVHKATHHFDIVNWLLMDAPKTVYANGTLRYYGRNGHIRGERCRTCRHRDTCQLVYRDGDIPYIKHMYFEAEGADGYFRDRCVFAEEIDIYDNMSLSVQYERGALLTYSLIAHSPYEGFRMTISGTKGRMEASQTMSGPEQHSETEHVYLYNRKGEKITYTFPKGQGTHGGGDERLLTMLLRGETQDPLGQFAGSQDGVLSAMVGIAANESIRLGEAVSIPRLLGRDVCHGCNSTQRIEEETT